MPKRKEAEEFAAVGEKDYWHLYGLQMLAPNKFVSVVGKVLSGKYTLISSRWKRRAHFESYPS
ncbi:MAG: hypothetical protein ACOYVF_11380 [Candidatus Zixiibacteriota bacterium]